MAASSPAPGAGPVFGSVVVVVPTGAEPGRQTSLYLSLSAPFVVAAFALIRISPFENTPFLFGPVIGTTNSTGAEHVVALEGNPIAATAASRPPVSILLFPFLALKLIFRISAALHLGKEGLLWFRHTVGLKRHTPLRTPSASQGSPSAQVAPLKTFFPPGKPIPLVSSWIRQSVRPGPFPATMTPPALFATTRTRTTTPTLTDRIMWCSVSRAPAVTSRH